MFLYKKTLNLPVFQFFYVTFAAIIKEIKTQVLKKQRDAVFNNRKKSKHFRKLWW